MMAQAVAATAVELDARFPDWYTRMCVWQMPPACSLRSLIPVLGPVHPADESSFRLFATTIRALVQTPAGAVAIGVLAFGNTIDDLSGIWQAEIEARLANDPEARLRLGV